MGFQHSAFHQQHVILIWVKNNLQTQRNQLVPGNGPDRQPSDLGRGIGVTVSASHAPFIRDNKKVIVYTTANKERAGSCYKTRITPWSGCVHHEWPFLCSMQMMNKRFMVYDVARDLKTISRLFHVQVCPCTQMWLQLLVIYQLLIYQTGFVSSPLLEFPGRRKAWWQ